MKFDQTTLIEKLNLIVARYNSTHGSNKQQMNSSGVCMGLIIMYKKHKKNNTHASFFDLIKEINALTENDINDISEKHLEIYLKFSEKIKKYHAEKNSNSVYKDYMEKSRKYNFKIFHHFSLVIKNSEDIKKEIEQLHCEFLNHNISVDFISINHIVTLNFQENISYFYDPNLEDGEVVCDSLEQAAGEIFEAFSFLRHCQLGEKAENAPPLIIKIVPNNYKLYQQDINDNANRFINKIKNMQNNNVDLNSLDVLGKTLLWEAVECEDEDAVNFLLAADVEHQPLITGLFPLHHCILIDKLNLLNLFLNKFKGAEKNVKFNELNLLQFAIITCITNKEIIEKLCCIPGMLNNKCVPLAISLFAKNPQISMFFVKELLVYGAPLLEIEAHIKVISLLDLKINKDIKSIFAYFLNKESIKEEMDTIKNLMLLNQALNKEAGLYQYLSCKNSNFLDKLKSKCTYLLAMDPDLIQIAHHLKLENLSKLSNHILDEDKFIVENSDENSIIPLPIQNSFEDNDLRISEGLVKLSIFNDNIENSIIKNLNNNLIIPLHTQNTPQDNAPIILNSLPNSSAFFKAEKQSSATNISALEKKINEDKQNPSSFSENTMVNNKRNGCCCCIIA